MQNHIYLNFKLIIVLYFIGANSFSQEQNMLYFDLNWEPTTKENHVFYRPMPLKKIGKLVLIEDFYKNGNRQMQGYVLKDNQEKYIGDIYWYDENGMDSNYSQYYNPTKNQELIYYYPDGKIWKKVQYKDDVKEGNTIIYNKDGSVLMSGFYKKGIPYSGDFIRVKNSNYYYGESLLEEEIFEDIMIEEEFSTNETLKSKEITETQPESYVYEKLYWVNSKQLAEVKEYKKNIYSRAEYNLISQKNYSKTKQLLQDLKEEDIEYGYRIKNGVEYEYYTQNNFIVALKSEKTYINESINGKVISYFANGKTKKTEQYKNGIKNGETLEFNEQGNLKNKLIYKDGEPFEGNFTHQFNSNIIIYSTYKNGFQVGDVIAKTESEEIITKGIYKNGKPFQGTFIIEDSNRDKNEIINVENFKQVGKQIIFNYNYLQPVETYTIENDMKNGESVFYDDGTIISKIIFKNDEPYDGILSNNHETLTYKKGNLIEQITNREYYNGEQKIVRQFENNLPVKVSYINEFYLTDNPQNEYVGVFKNGEPFDGYFNEGDDELKTVDFYVNGKIKHQYSNDYLKNMDNYAYQEYDLKSTFKDRKVFDGMEYHRDDNSYISRKWENGELQTIDLDLFAMHYFNRIHFALLNNKIEISEYKSKGKIIIEEKNNKLVKSLVLNDRILISNTISRTSINDALPKNISRIYLIKNNAVEVLDIENQNTDLTIINEVGDNNLDILYKFYSNIIYDKNSVKEYFLEINNAFNSEKEYYRLFNYVGDSQDAESITGLQTNEKSQVKLGIHITQNSNKNYDLNLFYDTKSIEFVKNISFLNLKSEIKRLTKKLDIKMND